MIKLIFISVGGILGSLLRYYTYLLINYFFASNFPYGTFIVNASGCFIIGLFYGILKFFTFSEHMNIFIFVGFLSSFTTFSTFSLENFQLLQNGNYILFFTNIFLTIITGIGLVFVGFFIAKYFHLIYHLFT